MQKTSNAIDFQEASRKQWLDWFRYQWLQSEHIALIGPSGSGKTSLMLPLLKLRNFVVVLAIKRNDDILDLFADKGYEIVEDTADIMPKWAMEDNERRIILWIKPTSLSDTKEQAERIEEALNHLYLAGSWAIFVDDTGYISGQLGLSKQLGILLNQGRSSYLSIVCAMTQPHSIIARVPSESFKQCKHLFIFAYTDLNEIKACAEIAGMPWQDMQFLQSQLDIHDFVYVGKRRIILVRSTQQAGSP